MLFIKTRSGKSLTNILCLLIFFSLVSFTNAQSINPKILIKGNTRTTTSYLNSVVENCLENQESTDPISIDLKMIQECVLNTKLFSKAEITLDNDVLTVEIHDRWTLIPVPMVVSEKGKETSYGALVMENNFLGSGIKLIAGGTMSASNNFMVIMVEDPSLFFSDWGLKLMGGKSHKSIESFEADQVVDGLEIDTRFYTTNLGYRFNSYFKSNVQLSYHQFEYNDFDGYETPESVTSISAGLSAKLDFSKFKFYYQEGFSSNLKYQENISRTDDAAFTKSLKLKMNWQMETINSQAFQLGFLSGNIHNADRRSALRVGSKNGFRGIPGEGAWTNAYYALSMDYQIPLSSSGHGTWTLAPFLDNGLLIQQADNQATSYLSYGIGSYFFLKKVAIPGIGLIIGTNSEYQKNFFKFTIGFDI